MYKVYIITVCNDNTLLDNDKNNKYYQTVFRTKKNVTVHLRINQ